MGHGCCGCAHEDDCAPKEPTVGAATDTDTEAAKLGEEPTKADEETPKAE